MSEKRNHILNTAKSLFLKNGIKYCTMQSIAEACNISKGAIYLHFKSKEDLILAISELQYEKLWRTLEEIVDDEQLSAYDKLIKVIINQIDDADDNQAFTQLLLQDGELTINDRMMDLAHEARYRDFALKQSLISEMYHLHENTWRIDFSVILNAFINELMTVMVFEQVPIEADRVATYCLTLIDDLVKSRSQSEMPSLFSDGAFPDLKEINEKLLQRKNQQINRALLQLNNTIGKLDVDSSERKTLLETVELLEGALKDYPANKNLALLQALLANFRNFSDLKEIREDLANVLGVDLI